MSQFQGARQIGGILRWFRRHGYTLLFALSSGTLAVLVSWWALFLRETIMEQRAMRYEALKNSATSAAYQLIHENGGVPALGALSSDPRLVVVPRGVAGPHMLVSLEPNWPELCIAARPQYLLELKEDYARKNAMILGESSVILLALAFSAFMLHRITWLERRGYREMREFWSRVTHELKTPITGIKAFLQTIQQREFNREQLLPLISMALKEVERQEMLAENILVGQRLERGGQGLQVRSVQLPGLLRELVDRHRMFLPDENVSLLVNMPEGTSVRVDIDALRVILENLTDNAMKYGGKLPQITWEASLAGKVALVRVRDNGMGFDPKHKEEMFQAFQRLKSEQHGIRQGTGMGLYISRQLARKMGGQLHAYSEGPGTGSEFTITLRVA